MCEFLVSLVFTFALSQVRLRFSLDDALTESEDDDIAPQRTEERSAEHGGGEEEDPSRVEQQNSDARATGGEQVIMAPAP